MAGWRLIARGMIALSSPVVLLGLTDRYFREHASQDTQRDVACVFVAVRPETTAICGY